MCFFSFAPTHLCTPVSGSNNTSLILDSSRYNAWLNKHWTGEKSLYKTWCLLLHEMAKRTIVLNIFSPVRLLSKVPLSRQLTDVLLSPIEYGMDIVKEWNVITITMLSRCHFMEPIYSPYFCLWTSLVVICQHDVNLVVIFHTFHDQPQN